MQSNLNQFISEEAVQDRLPNGITQQGSIDWLRGQMDEYRKLMSYYNCAMMEITTKFNVLNEEFSLQHDRNPIESVKSRLKSFYSIQSKLERGGFELSTASIEQNLNDVAGVRVICSFLDDVYMLAEALLMQDDITLIARKDYITHPKANGYRSLHLIVAVPIFLAHEKRMMRVEIQLRTIAMDFWASLEHQMKYKKEVSMSQSLARELGDCADVSALLDQRMNEIRKRLEKESRIGNNERPSV